MAPKVAPSKESPHETYHGGDIIAFIGAIVFCEVGSVLLNVGALNANNTGSIGWAVEQLFADERNDGNLRLDLEANRHHCHQHYQNISIKFPS